MVSHHCIREGAVRNNDALLRISMNSNLSHSGMSSCVSPKWSSGLRYLLMMLISINVVLCQSFKEILAEVVAIVVA
eukprot:15365633-Ditylum_brightwellii.AAC.1